MSPVVVQVLITLGVIGPALIGGLFLRRRRHVDVAVSLSADARAWAEQFSLRADRSERTATAARDRADRADARAEQARLDYDGLRVRVEQLEQARGVDRGRVVALIARLDQWTAYTRTLLGILAEHAIPHPDPPPEWSEST